MDNGRQEVGTGKRKTVGGKREISTQLMSKGTMKAEEKGNRVTGGTKQRTGGSGGLH